MKDLTYYIKEPIFKAFSRTDAWLHHNYCWENNGKTLKYKAVSKFGKSLTYLLNGYRNIESEWDGRITEYASVQLLHSLTGDPKDHIWWELGHAKVNDIDWGKDYETEFPEENYGTGFSLINFITFYLNFHCKIYNGWAPAKYQKGYWEDQDKYTGTYDGRF